jgi:hypothetical protein
VSAHFVASAMMGAHTHTHTHARIARIASHQVDAFSVNSKGQLRPSTALLTSTITTEALARRCTEYKVKEHELEEKGVLAAAASNLSNEDEAARLEVMSPAERSAFIVENMKGRRLSLRGPQPLPLDPLQTMELGIHLETDPHSVKSKVSHMMRR